MSIRQLVTNIVFIALFVMSARISMDTDSWWHLRAGQWIVENREIIRFDHFSYTRLGEDWQYPGWLFEAPMYLIYRQLGAGGLNLLTAGMVTLSFVFLWFSLRGGIFLRAFITILAASVSGVYWSARPHLITLVFAAIFLFILEGERWQPDLRSRRRLWFLPPLMLLWVNGHGGFAVGFILCGIYAFSRLASWLWQGELFSRLKSISQQPRLLFDPDYWLFWVSITLVFASLLNPSGAEILLYPFKTVSIIALQENIQEWQSPNFHQLSVQPFIWMLLAIIALTGVSKRRMALTDFLLVAVFAYMGFLAGRNLALFALAASPVLARHGENLSVLVGRKLNLRTEEKAPKRLQIVNWLLLLVIAAAGLLKVASIFPSHVNQAAFRTFLPLDAVNFIRDDLPSGNLFNSYNWGGYMIWELPEAPVFVDGRTDLYNDEIISQWLAVYQGQPGWQEVLQRWQVGWVFLEKEAPLVAILEQAGWKQLYSDELAVIYER